VGSLGYTREQLSAFTVVKENIEFTINTVITLLWEQIQNRLQDKKPLSEGEILIQTVTKKRSEMT